MSALKDELDGIKQSRESELNLLRGQLTAAIAEKQKLKTDYEEQLK